MSGKAASGSRSKGHPSSATCGKSRSDNPNRAVGRELKPTSKEMNFKRGFFRLWLVISLCWVAASSLFWWDQVASPKISDQVFIMPDATSGFFKLKNIFDQYDSDFILAHHSPIEFPFRVVLYPHKSVPEAVVKEKAGAFYLQYSKPREAEWWTARLWALAEMVTTAVVPPIIVFCLGWVMGWIFSGFRREPSLRR